MFDTSLVRAQAADPARRASLLAISIALHSAIAIGAIAAGIASVDFPDVAPDQLEIYRPVSLPAMPLGVNPNSKGPEPQKPAPKPDTPKTPTVVTQPEVIPQQTPEPSTPTEPGVDNTVAGPGPVGDGTGDGSGPFGDPNGKPGGTGDTPGGTDLGPGTGVLEPGGEVKSARVIRRVEPRYPAFMAQVRLKSATVIVRCVIDKNGRIRDPEIIQSTHRGFNNSVLEAVQQWTFEPGTHRGRPVDTWFELTVSFQMR